MDLVRSGGQMARNTKVTLEMVKLMEEALSIRQLETSTWESYSIANAKGMGHIFIKTVPGMRVNGMMTCKKERELKNCKMAPNSKGNIKEDRKTDTGNSNGLMVLNTKEIGKIINSKVMVNTTGQIKELIKANGNKICFMELADTSGQMEKFIMEIFKIIIKKEMDYLCGLMARAMTVVGKKTSRMEKLSLLIRKDRLKWVFGKAEKE